MKNDIGILVFLSFFMPLTGKAASLQKTLQKPLIVGASVSAGYMAPSPSKSLALRFTDEANIRVLAANGRHGREILKSVSEKTLADRTAVIGLDLFFWDSTRTDVNESVRALNTLVKNAKALDVPVVLGDSPAILPSYQPGRERLNKEIYGKCEAYEKCQVLPISRLLTQVLQQGHLQYKGKRYTLPELLPDGLHLSQIASEYLADEMFSLLKAKERI